MADAVYVVTKLGVTPDRFDMTDQERAGMIQKANEVREKAGGERVMMLGCYAGNGRSVIIDKFPSIAAYEGYRTAIFESGLGKYWTIDSELCFKRGE